MPLVRIDVQQGRTPEELRKLADTIQDVMLDVSAAPPRDRYQIISEHDKSHIIAEDTGLDLERSDGIVIIQVFQQGRSTEQKLAMYAVYHPRT
jgi:phenylpyruvate tautomerase PptA (4-oxalocrotonate tautomerase family)